MSTDKQQHSLANQAKALFAYAEEHQIDVVKTYSDSGKSGLTFKGRNAIRQLIADVQSRTRQFDVVLTYDVSRWGRFQDVDESAYYEQICRRAGIEVIYCAESFCDYEGPMAGILKNLKRTMAAEYSRELSRKISQTHHRLAELGYHAGGRVGFGLRRMAMSSHGELLGVLAPGQRRSYRSEKVVVRPGPECELEIIRRIFYEFTVRNWRASKIIRGLNVNPANWPSNKPWSLYKIKRVLTNENYIGNVVFRCFGGSTLRKDGMDVAGEIIRHEHAFDPIVPIQQFQMAADRIRYLDRTFDDGKMIQMLQELYAKKGKVSRCVIERIKEMPKWTTYRDRFGGLRNAYALAGVPTTKDCSYIEFSRARRMNAEDMLDLVADELYEAGRLVVCDRKRNVIHVNNAWSMLVKLVRGIPNESGSLRWSFSICKTQHADLCLLVRLDTAGRRLVDLYLIPALSIRPGRTTMAVANNAATDMYRIQSTSQIWPLGNRYMADVTDCTDRFGRWQKGVDRTRRRVYSEWHTNDMHVSIEKSPKKART
jgi:DNA invertase Pin-like site-specific DNA recombinase